MHTPREATLRSLLLPVWWRSVSARLSYGSGTTAIHLFVRGTLNEWLDSLGASELDERVSLDFAILDDLDELKPEHGKLFILLKTSDGCGFLAVGKALARLEQEEPAWAVPSTSSSKER